MAELKLTFAGKLSCGKCEEVLLWLHNPTKLLVNQGVTDPEDQIQLIRAEIVDITVVNAENYQYTIEYDEQLLLNPNSLLQECDIKQVCCAGCVIQYVDEAVASKANSVIVVNGDNTFTHTSGDGTEVTVDYGHSLSQDVDGDDTLIILTKPNGAQDIVTLSIPVPGGSFTCDPDFETWLQCLEAVRNGLECAFDVEVLCGRIESYPVTLTRIETYNGDIIVNVSGNDAQDLVDNLNAAGLSGFSFAVQGDGIRIFSDVEFVTRVEFEKGEECDWCDASVVEGSCQEANPQFERFCEVISSCLAYEISLDAGSPNVLVLSPIGGGLTSTVDLCPAVTECLTAGPLFTITDGSTSQDINLSDSIEFQSGDGMQVTLLPGNTLEFVACISADAGNRLIYGTDSCLHVPPETVTSLVENDDGTLTYTDETGAPNNVNVGPTQIDGASVFGPDHMVQSLSIVGDNLLLTSAPNISASKAGSPVFAGAVQTISNSAMLTNPNLYRPMQVHGVDTWGHNYSRQTVNVHGDFIELERQQDAGGWLSTGGAPNIDIPSDTNAVFYGHIGDNAPLDVPDIAPGGNYSTTIEYRTPFLVPGYSPISWASAIRLIGWSK